MPQQAGRILRTEKPKEKFTPLCHGCLNPRTLLPSIPQALFGVSHPYYLRHLYRSRYHPCVLFENSWLWLTSSYEVTNSTRTHGPIGTKNYFKNHTHMKGFCQRLPMSPLELHRIFGSEYETWVLCTAHMTLPYNTNKHCLDTLVQFLCCCTIWTSVLFTAHTMFPALTETL